jgi:CRISPR type I-E-associated protein CasB/Cse2
MARIDHETGRFLGRTLAESGFHELRLRRLLRASGERLWDELRAAVQFLATKGVGIDWREAAELVRFDPAHQPERSSSIRRRIARAFFSVQL